MISPQPIAAYASPIEGAPGKLWVVLIALGALAFFSVAYGSNREVAQQADSQVAHEETAFCHSLGLQAGVQYDTCIRQVSLLMRREREIRAIEF